jgi:hypothetical protein
MSNTNPRRHISRYTPESAPGRNSPALSGPFELSLEVEPRRSPARKRNPDPYNSSGSFDRTKNWARVGKR